jgi:hypothetical protein
MTHSFSDPGTGAGTAQPVVARLVDRPAERA